MVVQHNLTAMNSNRMLNLTVKSQAKSTEKLSSGYKINRAADDAAGLSISEKMRKQIRGLTQASNNAQDGISCVQTAEGALNEVQDMLQRMNELAVKAANGTNSSDDRTYIQNEIDQLKSEIGRVSETTKFNETYLLKGNTQLDKVYEPKYVVDDASATIADGVTLYKDDLTATYTAASLGTALAADPDTEVYTSTGTAATGAAVDGSNKATAIIYNKDGSVKYNVGDTVSTSDKANIGDFFTAAPSKAVAGRDYTIETKQLYDINGNKIPFNGLDSYVNVAADGTVTYRDDAPILYTDNTGTTQVVKANISDYVTSTQTKTAALDLKLHVGADATSNNQIIVQLEALTTDGLGITDLRVDGTNDVNALDAIDRIKAAIQRVSTQRSALGAVQNRLDHTINNLDNVVENTTSAESSIRDTDMATEMVRYSNNNILAQAGQSMLAQANQSNQGVLSLLQ